MTYRICVSTKLPELVLFAFEWWDHNGHEQNYLFCLYKCDEVHSHNHIFTSSWEPYAKAEVQWPAQPDAERMEEQWSFLAPRAMCLPTCHIAAVQIWRVLCSHKAIHSEFPFQGSHDVIVLGLSLSSVIGGISKLEILSPSFFPFFDIWGLLAPLDVCSHWSVKAQESWVWEYHFQSAWRDGTDQSPQSASHLKWNPHPLLLSGALWVKCCNSTSHCPCHIKEIRVVRTLITFPVLDVR